jgi:RHS repeat-associated protein
VLDDGTWRYVWAEGRLLYQVRKSDNARFDAHLSPQGSLIGFSQWQCNNPPSCSNSGVRWVARFENSEYGSHNGSTPGWESQLIRYTGHVYDKESNLNFMRARSQDPETGRFMSRDTWTGRDGRPQSKNRYAYAEGNPASRVDPSGRHPRGGAGSLAEYGRPDLSRTNADGTHPIVDAEGNVIGGAYYEPRHHAYVYQGRPDLLRSLDPLAIAAAHGNNVIICRALCPYGSYIWWHEFAHLSQSRRFACVDHDACFDHNYLADRAYLLESWRAELEAIANGRPGQGYYYNNYEKDAHAHACGKVPDAEECKRPWPPE